MKESEGERKEREGEGGRKKGCSPHPFLGYHGQAVAVQPRLLIAVAIVPPVIQPLLAAPPAPSAPSIPLVVPDNSRQVAGTLCTSSFHSKYTAMTREVRGNSQSWARWTMRHSPTAREAGGHVSVLPETLLVAFPAPVLPPAAKAIPPRSHCHRRERMCEHG